ncbi:MAG: type VII secretion protein EccB [Dermatophilaceae bacterium]
MTSTPVRPVRRVPDAGPAPDQDRPDAEPEAPSPVSPRWSQREQLTSHQFQRRRLVRSLVVSDPESVERPDKRLVVSVVVGAVIGALALAVMAVIGIIKPGNSQSWKSGDAIILEKETGTRYILSKEGMLQPALNFSSAVLALGGRDKVVSVSRKSLDGVPRGAPFGIPGAPDALPADEDLIAGPWTACSQAAVDGRGAGPSVTVDLGRTPDAAPLATGSGVLVQAAGTNEQYLLVGGRRHLIGSTAVLTALGWPQEQPLSVGTAWIDTVPAGGDLRFLAVAGEGQPGPAVAGRDASLGQVFELSGTDGTRRFWVLTRDGLADIPATAAVLYLANPNAPAGEPVRITAQQAGSAPLAAKGVPGSDLPNVVPRAAPVPEGPAVAVCATATAGRGQVAELRLAATAFDDGTPGVPAGPRGDGASPADAVRVRAGSGALVVPAGGEGVAATFLVTDQGVKYPLTSTDAAAALGFDDRVRATATPAAILALLPTGPTLDPQFVADAPDDERGPIQALSSDGYFERRSAGH